MESSVTLRQPLTRSARLTAASLSLFQASHPCAPFTSMRPGDKRLGSQPRTSSRATRLIVTVILMVWKESDRERGTWPTSPSGSARAADGDMFRWTSGSLLPWAALVPSTSSEECLRLELRAAWEGRSMSGRALRGGGEREREERRRRWEESRSSVVVSEW